MKIESNASKKRKTELAILALFIMVPHFYNQKKNCIKSTKNVNYKKLQNNVENIEKFHKNGKLKTFGFSMSSLVNQQGMTH